MLCRQCGANIFTGMVDGKGHLSLDVYPSVDVKSHKSMVGNRLLFCNMYCLGQFADLTRPTGRWVEINEIVDPQ